MKKKVAISAEADGFNQNRILDYDIAKNYPGALWAYFLKEFLFDEYEVVTADVALEKVGNGLWRSDDVLVVQHVHDCVADNLISRGCRPLLLLCFESPLYVGYFYDHCETIASKFEYQYLPTGLVQGISHVKLIHPKMCFPSYDATQIAPNQQPWSDRKSIVLVASNKFTIPRFPTRLLSPSYLLWWLKNRILDLIFGERYDSIKFPMAQCELQNYRLELVTHLLSTMQLDIFGRGWNRLKGLPPLWRKELRRLLPHREVMPCQDKIKKISDYKFCLCIENASFPGYVTEKIIDCYVAGVVPVYIGAPDIKEILPKDSFVDLRVFKNFNDISSYLNNMRPQEAENMINIGRNFLLKKENLLFSYQGFARSVELIIRQEN